MDKTYFGLLPVSTDFESFSDFERPDIYEFSSFAFIGRIPMWDSFHGSDATPQERSNSHSLHSIFISLSVNEDEFKQQARLTAYQQLLLRMFGNNFECVPIAGGFSGSSVIKITPFDSFGNREESVIVKLDSAQNIRTEAAHSLQAQIALGDIAARILGDPIYFHSDTDGNEYGAFKMELAGAVLQVPELSSGTSSSSIINTFKDLFLYEAEDAVLGHMFQHATHRVPESEKSVECIELHIEGEGDMRDSFSDQVQKLVQLEGWRPFGSVPSILKEIFSQDGSVHKSLRRYEEGCPSIRGRISSSDPNHPCGGQFLISRLPHEFAENETSMQVLQSIYSHRGGSEPVPNPYIEINKSLAVVKETLRNSLPKQWHLLRGFCHGDLNGSNIIIDATDGMWLIDFATARKLPLNGDVAKLETCIIFEYCFVPIPISFLEDLVHLVDSSLLARWLRVEVEVADILVAHLEANRIGSEEQLNELLMELRTEGCSAQSIRRLRARIVVEESVFWEGLAFATKTLVLSLIPEDVRIMDDMSFDSYTMSPETVGSSSLLFGLRQVMKMRRFAYTDTACFYNKIQSETQGDNFGLFNCDVSVVSFAVVLLREAARVVGYEDIPPWTKVIAAEFASQLTKVIVSECARISAEGLIRVTMPELALRAGLTVSSVGDSNRALLDLVEERRKYLKFIKSKYGYLVDFISGKQLDVLTHCCQFRLAACGSNTASGVVSLDHIVRVAGGPANAGSQYLIRGIPGSGKSCLLRRLAAEAVSVFDGETGMVPLIIPVVEWTKALLESSDKNTDSLITFLSAVYSEDPDRREFLLQSLQCGRVVLLVDGLDDTDDAALIAYLEKCAKEGTRIVATFKTGACRESLISELVGAGFIEAEICPLDNDQRRFIVKSRLGSSHRDGLMKFESFYDSFERSIGAGEGLIKSPAFLSMMICYWLHHTGGGSGITHQLPPNTAGIERQTSLVRAVTSAVVMSMEDVPLSRTVLPTPYVTGHTGMAFSASIADIYRVALSVLVHRYQVFQESDRSRVRDSAKRLLELLRLIGFRMKCSHVEEFTDSDICLWLSGSELGIWQKLAENIRLGKFLIVSYAVEEGDFVYRFALSSLLDFLAADHIISSHPVLGATPNTGGDGVVTADVFSLLPSSLNELITSAWWSSMISMLVDKSPLKYVKIIERKLVIAGSSDSSQTQDNCLHVAARAGHLPIFKVLNKSTLLESFIHRPNALSLLPLHEAARAGQAQICRLLLAARADPWAATADGWCALHYAASVHSRDVISALLQESQRFVPGTARIPPAGVLNAASFNQLPQMPRQQLTRLSSAGLELGKKILNKSVSSSEFIATAKLVFPELSYFRGRSDTTPDSSASVNLEPSEIEYRRTLGAMLSVFWVVSDNFEEFAASQNESVRLSRQSWDDIRQWTISKVSLTSPEAVDAMLCLMAIHDLGKLKDFRHDLASDYKDHDAAMKYIINTTPEVLPSLCRLSDYYQYAVRTSMTIDFNYGQFLQAENMPQNLTSIKEMIADKGQAMLGFYLFHIFADMSGIMGAISLNGSLFMTETMYSNFGLGIRALSELAFKSPNEVYNAFLSERANSQGLRFEPTTADRSIARLACLSRVFEKNGGTEVLSAWESLEDSTKQVLSEHLSRTGISDQHSPAFLVYYAPAFMENCRKNPAVGLSRAMQFLARVYLAAEHAFSADETKHIKRGRHTPVVTIHIAEAAEIGKRSAIDFESVCFRIVRSTGSRQMSEGTLRISPWKRRSGLISSPVSVDTTRYLETFREPHAVAHQILSSIGSVYPEFEFYKTRKDEGDSFYGPMGKGLTRLVYLLSNNFEAFSKLSMDVSDRLTNRSWQELVKLLQATLETLDCVMICLVVSKLGSIKQLLLDLSVSASEPTAALLEILNKHSSAVPSFNRLSPQFRRVALNCLQLPFSMGQLISTEKWSIESLRTLRSLFSESDVFRSVWVTFSVLVVASSATSLSESSYQNFKRILSLISVDQDVTSSIYDYLRFRGAQQDLLGFNLLASPRIGFSSSGSLGTPASLLGNAAESLLSPDSTALIRLACLANVSFATGGSVVKLAFSSISPALRLKSVGMFLSGTCDRFDGLSAFLTASKCNSHVGLDVGLAVLGGLMDILSRDSEIRIDLKPLVERATRHVVPVPFQNVVIDLVPTFKTTVRAIPRRLIPVAASDLDEVERLTIAFASLVMMGGQVEPMLADELVKTYPELSFVPEAAEKVIGWVRSLVWVITDKYDSFVRVVSTTTVNRNTPRFTHSLSPVLWLSMREWVNSTVVSPEVLDALIVDLVLIGVAHSENPDNASSWLSAQIRQNPESLPSFNRLSFKYKRLIQAALESGYSVSRFLQADTGMGELERIKDFVMSQRSFGLHFATVSQVCQTAASSSFTDIGWRDLRTSIDLLTELEFEDASNVYRQYLVRRGGALLSDFRCRETTALARLMCLARLRSHMEARVIERAYDELSRDKKQLLLNYLMRGIEAQQNRIDGLPELLMAMQRNDCIPPRYQLEILIKVLYTCELPVNNVDLVTEWAREVHVPDADKLLEISFDCDSNGVVRAIE